MLPPLKPFNTIGAREMAAVVEAVCRPLSGYLASRTRGGHSVRWLEQEWRETFNVKHAIACNSATSGLMAAAFAVGLGPGDVFAVPAMTMSATAAAPMFTGATPFFMDVNSDDFGLRPGAMPDNTRAIFSTNLFGYPASLGRIEWDKTCGIHLIEDNSQSPFAMAHGRYAGTMGTIGVWSLNVHKHLQCGEGGIITTDDDDLAALLRAFINHGENLGGEIGLNLRMPEVCAAIAAEQLRRAPDIIHGRVEQAQEILHAIGKLPGIRPPVIQDDCAHVFYTIPFLVEEMRVGSADCDFNPFLSMRRRRELFCFLLREQGVPIVEGYVPPLYRMPAFESYARPCPVAEQLHDETLFYFENCAWDPTAEQIRQIGDVFKRAAERLI